MAIGAISSGLTSIQDMEALLGARGALTQQGAKLAAVNAAAAAAATSDAVVAAAVGSAAPAALADLYL